MFGFARSFDNGGAAVNITQASAVQREICSEHTTHHMLPVQQWFSLEILVVIPGQMQKPTALRLDLRPNESNPLVRVPSVQKLLGSKIYWFEMNALRVWRHYMHADAAEMSKHQTHTRPPGTNSDHECHGPALSPPNAHNH